MFPVIACAISKKNLLSVQIAIIIILISFRYIYLLCEVFP